MVFIKWLAFYLIAAIWVLFFSVISYYTYQSEYEKYISEQKNLLSLTCNSLESYFKQHEVLLDVIAAKLTQYGQLPNPITAQYIINSIISVDSSMLGVGIFMVNGDAYVASSSRPLPINFNLLNQPENRDSFQQTLDEPRMILGRTYYSNALKTIAFPLRKAVRDGNGKVLYVLSAVVDLEKSFDFFSNYLKKESQSGFYVYRERDRYFQFVLSRRKTSLDIFNYQIPKLKTDTFVNEVESQTNLSYAQVKHQGLIVTNTSQHPNVVSMAVSQYMQPYELWVETRVNAKHINQQFFKDLVVLASIFLGSLLIIYLLFSRIVASEMRKKKALEYQANSDYLTKLKNRFFFDQYLTSIDQNTPFHLLFIDLDNFKVINDSYGHELGDKVLQEVARRLQKVIQSEDLLVRFSGDEFIIITFEQERQNIKVLCKEILTCLNKNYLVGKYNFILSGSIGVAGYPHDGQDLDELKRHADLAMYEAKKQRNTTVFFREELKETYVYNAQIEHELKTALENDEFYMVYQPQINRDGTIHGVEALIRWENDTLGFVAPDKFISIAESCGEMPSIGCFVIERSFSDMQALYAAIGIDMALSINVSVKQFQHEAFLEQLFALIEKYSWKNRELVLEVTESVFIENVFDIQLLLSKIKERGVRISLDDFGTGYSSLSLLNQLPIDELKIDKSFIDNILTDPNTYSMVEGIIAIAQKLNFTTVVEGVETDEQRAVLHDLECDIYQGYLFSKPLNIKELTQYIQRFD